jgi:hypothetical protein
MRYVETSHIKIADVEAKLEGANQLIDDYIFDVGLKEKDQLRLKLLCEEVLRLAKSIIGLGIMDFWLEGTSRVTRIYLSAENHMDKAKQQELISVSSSGENSSEKGFFGVLKSMFLMQGIDDEEWNLKDYLQEVYTKREQDPYSQEAWDDLERSLVAKLADDIDVYVDKNNVKMVVTKDFSEALSTVGSRVPQAITPFTFIDSAKKNDIQSFKKVDELLEDLDLKPKDAVHMKLLFEETVGMLKALTADYHAAIWFEKYNHECCIRVSGKTEMSQEKKEGLLGVASQKENTLVKGFMGKVGDIIENGLLNYSNVMKLQQEYGGGFVNYGTMGMYNGVEGMADSGIMWSLYEYRDALKENIDAGEEVKEAWDELEKSIVASLAKDVLVGVKGNRIDMTIVCDIK